MQARCDRLRSMWPIASTIRIRGALVSLAGPCATRSSSMATSTLRKARSNMRGFSLLRRKRTKRRGRCLSQACLTRGRRLGKAKSSLLRKAMRRGPRVPIWSQVLICRGQREETRAVSSCRNPTPKLFIILTSTIFNRTSK